MIKAGSTFNVTWHLGYPHQGGFKLELLDSNEKKIMELTPVTEDSTFVAGDTTYVYLFICQIRSIAFDNFPRLLRSGSCARSCVCYKRTLLRHY